MDARRAEDFARLPVLLVDVDVPRFLWGSTTSPRSSTLTGCRMHEIIDAPAPGRLEHLGDVRVSHMLLLIRPASGWNALMLKIV